MIFYLSFLCLETIQLGYLLISYFVNLQKVFYGYLLKNIKQVLVKNYNN